MSIILNATAVIRARDLFSGPVTQMANRVLAAQKRIKDAGHTARSFGERAVHARHALTGLATGMALPLGFVEAKGLHGLYEWEAQLHRVQAISEATPEAMNSLKQSITSISNATGVQAQELVEAAQGWLELGNGLDTFGENAAVAARTSRITGIEVVEQMKESSALMRAWGHQMSETETFRHFEEVYLVASKGMKGGAHAFGEAMQSWAPIAAGLKLTFEEASAFVQSLGGQFDPSSIGNALKTGFLRLAAPVPKAEAMLRSQGIDRAKLFRYDAAKVKDAGALANMLRGAGSFTVSKQVERLIARDVATFDPAKGVGYDEIVDRLNQHLAAAFGGKKMSAQDRKILQAAILQHMSGAATGLDPREFFRAFAPLSTNLAFMSAVFGKEHAAKFMDLLKQAEHFDENLARIHDHADGAVDRKWSLFSDHNFAQAWDQTRAAFDNMFKGDGGKAVIADLTAALHKLQGVFEWFQTADPQTVRIAFWATTALAAAAPLGFVLSGIADGLTVMHGAAGLGARGLGLIGKSSHWLGRGLLFPFRAIAANFALFRSMPGVIGKVGFFAFQAFRGIGALALGARTFATVVTGVLGVLNWPLLLGTAALLLVIDKWNWLKGFFSEIGDALADTALGRAFNTLVGWIETPLNLLKDMWGWLMKVFSFGGGNAAEDEAAGRDTARKLLGWFGVERQPAPARNWNLEDAIAQQASAGAGAGKPGVNVHAPASVNVTINGSANEADVKAAVARALEANNQKLRASLQGAFHD